MVKMTQGNIEDKDDIFIENIITAMVLFVGVLSVSASLILLIYSATIAIYSEQFLVEFLQTSAFAAFLFGVGFGALLLFRRRRKLKKAKATQLFSIKR